MQHQTQLKYQVGNGYTFIRALVAPNNARRLIPNGHPVLPFRPSKALRDIYQAIETVTKRPSYSGPAAKEKAKAAADGGGGADGGTDGAPGGGSGDGGGGDGDGDGGDGDADGDGPPRPSPSRHRSSCSPSRATRRSFIPKFLTRHAFACLVALAMLLAYLAPPSFAALFVQLGQPELAKEMLRYQPKLLMPLPAGWSTPG
jgi:hypothetical protein